MTGRMYTISFSAVSLSAAQDLFEISPADDKPVEICGLFLSQTGVGDIGDAAEELLKLAIIRGHSTGGSGGSAATPAPVKATAASVGFAAEVNNTTIASAGTGVTVHEDAWNVRAGYQFWWPEGAEPGASQANTTIVVRMASAPADAITVSGTLYVRELG